MKPARWSRRGGLAGAATLLSALLMVVPISVASAAQDQPQVKIREAVLDESGPVRLVVQPVGPGAETLQPNDLVVVEGGTTIADLQITRLDEERVRPVTVALVIDTSASMAGEAMDATKAAATAFVERVAVSGVRVLLIAFSDEPAVVARSSTGSAIVVDAIGGLTADGDTALYDAVVLATQELARLIDAQPNLVVFTDGGDTASSATLEDAVAAANEASVPVTAVTLATGESDLAALERLTGATGGSAFATEALSGLDAAFSDVATELTTQYVVRYVGQRNDVRELDIQVRWRSDAGPVADTITVLNPRQAPAVPVEITRRAPGLLGSPAALVLGTGAVFLGAAMLLSLLLARPSTRASRLLDRDLSAYIAGDRSAKGRSVVVAQVLRNRAQALIQTAPRPRGVDERLQHRLDQAAWPLRSWEFYAIQIGAALVLVVPVLVFTTWWLAPLGLVVGAAVPHVVLEIQRSRRRTAFLARFPDTLQLLAGSLRAGYGILQAFASVGTESGPPTSEEFSRVLAETRLGAPLEDSLDAMADRMDSEDVRWVVLAIKIQREVGGNLAELLTTVARTLREREALRRQIRVLSAEGKLSAVILIVLPFLLAGYLTLANPDYVRVLIDERVGWILIGGGLALMGAGVVWIRRMIRIEV